MSTPTAPSEPPAVAVQGNIQISNYGAQPDSAYDSEVASYTTSLASNITDYKHEYGRRYHAYKEGGYAYPNDEKESDRLDIMHKLVEVSLGGKLHLAPISKDPQRILDIGTGTGIWAIEMGDMFPKAEVLGNDLSPIQPRWVPPNVRFEVDDVEADWTYHQKFDYIHCRCMNSAIHNWPRLVGQCLEFTKPGGYCEFIDLDMQYTSPDGSLREDHASMKTCRAFLDASRRANMEPCPGAFLEGWVKDAGFTEVVHQKLVLPVGTWAADKHLKEVGAWNYLQIMEGLEGFLYQLFTHQLGYSPKEVDVICANVRKEMKDPKIHTMFHMHVVYGKKPEEKQSEV